MEPSTPSSPSSSAAPHAPASVMDVVPPHTPASGAAGPVAVKAAPPDVADAEKPAPSEKSHKDTPKLKAQQSPAAKKPDKSSNGVGMAIAATVIIVLGLAALATYAFLKTQ